MSNDDMSIPPFIARMMAGGHDMEEDDSVPKLAPDIEAIRLRDAYESFQTKHAFAQGMIVRQKKSAAGYRDYGQNDLSIVMELVDPPLYFESNEHGASSPYFRKPLDMVIGCLCFTPGENKDSFHTYHVDSRHFEPVSEEDIALITKEAKVREATAQLEALGHDEYGEGDEEETWMS